MVDIYSRKPINKTAALVTSQSGCASDDSLTCEQKRENLVVSVKKLEKKMLLLDKKDPERKRLGQEKHEINIQINKLRPKKRTPGIERYVIDILRERLSKFEFDKLFSEAARRMKTDS